MFKRQSAIDPAAHRARGAALSALVHARPFMAEYTALQVKQAVVGQGKAAKAQVQHMVIRCSNCPARRPPTPPTRWPAPSAMPRRQGWRHGDGRLSHSRRTADDDKLCENTVSRRREKSLK